MVACAEPLGGGRVGDELPTRTRGPGACGASGGGCGARVDRGAGMEPGDGGPGDACGRALADPPEWEPCAAAERRDRFGARRLHVEGDVFDRHGSLAQLRGHYNAHKHGDPQGGMTSAPDAQD